jgi:hypothetical protein
MRVVALVLVLGIVGLGGNAAAKTDPVVACGAARLKAAGAAASGRLACHALAAQKGLVTDPTCLDGAFGKLEDAFAKAEAAAAKAGTACPGIGAVGTEGDIDAFVDDVVAALRPQTTPSKCVAKKLANVGKYAQKILAAHASQRVKPDALKFADKTTKAGNLLAALFAKLDEKGKDCQTSGNEPGMVTMAEGLTVAQVCDDTDKCTTDGIAGLVCLHTPITCQDHYACDFRSGACAYTDCCLMSTGGGFCVVQIPAAQIPTSQTYCQATAAAHAGLTSINSGPNCIGWRATGATDCF